jgi:hypothetical protein
VQDSQQLKHLRRFSRTILQRIVLSDRDLLTAKIDHRYIVTGFWIVFGVYGWGTFDASSNILSQNDLAVSVSILLTILCLHFLRFKINEALPTIRISPRLISSFCLFFSFAIILNVNYLNYDLTGDELFYARQSQIHSLELISALKQYIPFFLIDMNSKYLFQFVSLILLLIAAIYVKIIFKLRSDSIFLGISLISLLATRQLVQEFNPNTHILSPLPSVWYFFTSSIFGYHTFIYRASTLALYALLATALYNWYKGSTALSKTVTGLTALLLITVPLVNQMSVAVEPANWTFLVIVFFLLVLIRSEYRISDTSILLVSLSFYLRMNIGFLLAAAFFTHLIQSRRIRGRVGSIYFISSIIVLPGAVFTYITRISERISSESNVLEAVISNLKNTLDMTQRTSGLIYLIFAILSALILIAVSRSRLFAFSYMFFAFLLFQILQFPNLSGYVKYSVEYIYPLIFILPHLIFSSISKRRHAVSIFLIPGLLIVNIFGVTLRSEISSTYQQVYLNQRESGLFTLVGVMPFAPFPYGEIFSVIKRSNRSGCLNSGVVYGVFPEIEAGYSLKEVLFSIDVRDRFQKIQSELGEWSPSLTLPAVKGANLDCIVVGLVENQTIAVEALVANDWKIIQVSTDVTFGTKVFLLVHKAA